MLLNNNKTTITFLKVNDNYDATQSRRLLVVVEGFFPVKKTKNIKSMWKKCGNKYIYSNIINNLFT